MSSPLHVWGLVRLSLLELHKDADCWILPSTWLSDWQNEPGIGSTVFVHVPDSEEGQQIDVLQIWKKGLNSLIAMVYL